MDDIYPVIVGGGLALTGALFGTILTFLNSHLERRQRQRETIQQKFEELANMIDETVLWFPTLDLCKSNQSAVETHPPICHRRIATLALIYFPELIDDSRSYSSAIVEYYQWVINAVKLDGTRPIGEMVAELPEYFIILEHTENARQALQESIRKHAPKYTK